MAEKDTDKREAVAVAEEAAREVENTVSAIADAVVSGADAMDDADRELIEAEARAGKAIAKANEQLAAARERAEQRRLAALQELDSEGFVASTWGAHVKLQCIWCPWDAIGSPTGELDVFERMREHHAAAEPVTHSGPARYGRDGLPIA